MPQVKTIDIRGIFERAAGHKLPDPKPVTPYALGERPTIAGNLNTK